MTEQAADVKRWRGFTHKELYRMLHEGPGAQASADPSRRWAELAATLSEVGQDLRSTLDGSGAVWAGRAAGAAYDRLAPLSVWAQSTSEQAAGMRAAVENQGDFIARARADMPAPEDVPSQRPDSAVPAPVLVAGVQDDAEPVEAAQSAGAQKAFEVMAAYELNTTTNLAALTGFGKPAELLGSQGLHRNRGQGVDSSTHASFAGNHNIPHGAGHEHPRPPAHHGSGGFGHGGQGVGLASAAPSFANAEVGRRPIIQPGAYSGAGPVGPAPVVAPGMRSGADSESDRNGGNRGRRGPASPALGGLTSGADDFSGGSSSGTANAANAAGMASTANAASGAPMAPGMGAGGAGGAGSHDKMAMRRFGTEALGSSQWFGDAAESTGQGGSSAGGSRSLSGRRRDLSETEQVTESVSVYGEDHKLPPGVIGG